MKRKGVVRVIGSLLHGGDSTLSLLSVLGGVSRGYGCMVDTWSFAAIIEHPKR